MAGMPGGPVQKPPGEGRHSMASVSEEMLSRFRDDHSPPYLTAVSEPFRVLARSLAATLPEGRDKTAAVGRLLEAKDRAVRAVLMARPKQS